MHQHHWHQSMETGFPKIDDYHRKLAEYLSMLETAMIDGNRAGVAMLIENVIDHLEDNFPYEEQLMRQHDYPMLEDHLRVHESFLKRLNTYRDRHQKGEDISRKLTYDLKIWLTNHIQLQDGDYAAFIKRKTRKGPLGWLRKLTG